MKKLILVVIILFITGFVFISCEEDCANCRTKTTYTDGTVEYGDWVEYCDEALEEIENKDPITIGDATSEYECE
ncbi:MAG: hypothetical protein KAT68_12910 [Bacteroidales bacterium]|nr:hypothetical protein [Bacteroidales bacterium]